MLRLSQACEGELPLLNPKTYLGDIAGKVLDTQHESLRLQRSVGRQALGSNPYVGL